MIKLYVANAEGEYALDEDNAKFLNFCYAHSELQDKAKGDFLFVDKTNKFDRRKNIDGEDAIAVLPNGEEVMCVFYFWRAYRVYKQRLHTGDVYVQVNHVQKGLLCMKTDNEAISYAKRCFDNREKEL